MWEDTSMAKHNFGYFFHEGVSNMFSHGFMSFAAIGITVACLLIMGTFTLVAVNANALLLDLEQEAAKYAVSTDYLRHCFKLVNGISPYEFQLSQRYALAIRLLRETELPVGEIGDRCGFPVHRLFTQFIRKRSGFAPRELRKYM